MRWLPNREHPQHWALRLFQIAQVTALGTMPLMDEEEAFDLGIFGEAHKTAGRVGV